MTEKKIIFILILLISVIFILKPDLAFAFIDPGYGGYGEGYVPGAEGSGELCFNGIDDNGDGIVDEGC
jgi:hypothetical protein